MQKERGSHSGNSPCSPRLARLTRLLRQGTARLDSKLAAIHSGGREWKAETKRCTFSFSRFELDRAVVPLQNLIGLSQADATSVLLGREVELKNLVLHFARDAWTAIPDFRDYDIVLTTGGDRQQAALRHGLHPIQDHVEQRLLHQIDIRLDG